MGKSAIIVSVCAFMLASASAFAADPGASASPPPSSTEATTTAATASSNLDRVVCREGPAPTGSRLGGGRVCHTQRQWNDIQQQSQDQLSRQQINRGCQGTVGC